MKVLLPVIISLSIVGAVFAQSSDLILVEKAKRRMKFINQGKTIAVYSIALGSDPVGPKRCQGDGKTPEGRYIIASKNEGSSFHKSMKVSYPNDEDRKLSRDLKCDPGGDIMLHGLPNGRGWLASSHRLIDWTNGCIAITDQEMDELWSHVSAGTKVEIVP